MKKILSVFTAVALLFGFASCNGDMHEVDSEKQKDAFGLDNMLCLLICAKTWI